MKLRLDQRQAEFREEVRQTLERLLPEEFRDVPHTIQPLDHTISDRWMEKLHSVGWTFPSWPVEYGGTGWSSEQLSAFESELAEMGAPGKRSGLGLIGPLIYKFGSEEQKKRFLPGIYDCTSSWAQGFSEPEAGSDLAALRTKAVKDGDFYVVNGSKIWTSYAHMSEFCFCLVRTSTELRPQDGISYLLIDLSLPGIEIRPIRSIDGLHHLNQVYFTDVRVPADALLGEEGKAWEYTRRLLNAERGGVGSAAVHRRKLRLIREHARGIDDDGEALADRADFALKMASFEIEIIAGEAMGLARRSTSDPLFRACASSIAKIVGTELGQRITEFGMEVAGLYGQADQVERLLPESNETIAGPPYVPELLLNYLYGRAASIYGGTNEIQHNIIWRNMVGSDLARR